MKNIAFAGICSAVFVLSVQAIPGDARREEAACQADGLIEKMTPEERLGQLMMDSPEIKRLGVSKYHWWNEALHGFARTGLATVFPQSMGAAASFDKNIMRKVGDIVSTEARAKYNLFTAKGDRRIYRGLTVWSPNVNMFRDPRWGRGQETYGEDPYLSGVMGSAYTCGLQGDDPKYLKLSACAKHFAVHSGPENLRHSFNANVSPRDLREYYLPAFEMLVRQAKVESVMGAYSAINGVPCCMNKWLLTDLLRGEWGFKGHVVSDVGAVCDIYKCHKVVKDAAFASRATMAAGLDLCSEETYSALKDEVASGALKSEWLAVPLRHLYTTRALLGQFDSKGSTPWDNLGAESIATEEHRKVALKLAEESLVLVHNNGLLPLDASKIVCVGVGGPRAQDEIALLGNYCGYTDRPSTVLAGMLSVAGPGLRVTADNDDPELWGSDVLVMCLGITAADEGEEGGSANNSGADRFQYGIPDSQLEYLKYQKQKHEGSKIVSVVFGCSPLDLAPIVELSDAVIVAWYPGERGGEAIARTVFGMNNPAGRLPITYPKSYDDLPDFKDYALAGRTYLYATKEPLYPFGYGLSYTKFSYSGARVAAKGENGTQVVSVDVTNIGKLVGDEVVQAYVRAPAAAGDRRLHHLEGFERVTIGPGETKTVSIELPKSAFFVYGEDGKPSVPAGESTVFIGGGQPGFAETVSIKVSQKSRHVL